MGDDWDEQQHSRITSSIISYRVRSELRRESIVVVLKSKIFFYPLSLPGRFRTVEKPKRWWFLSMQKRNKHLNAPILVFCDSSFSCSSYQDSHPRHTNCVFLFFLTDISIHRSNGSGEWSNVSSNCSWFYDFIHSTFMFVGRIFSRR